MTLENRVSKLEARLTPATPEKTAIYVLWVGSTNGENEWRRLQRGDQIWHRLDNESEDDFKARALRETDTDQSGVLYFVNGLERIAL